MKKLYYTVHVISYYDRYRLRMYFLVGDYKTYLFHAMIRMVKISVIICIGKNSSHITIIVLNRAAEPEPEPEPSEPGNFPGAGAGALPDWQAPAPSVRPFLTDVTCRLYLYHSDLESRFHSPENLVSCLRQILLQPVHIAAPSKLGNLSRNRAL